MWEGEKGRETHRGLRPRALANTLPPPPGGGETLISESAFFCASCSQNTQCSQNTEPVKERELGWGACWGQDR